MIPTIGVMIAAYIFTRMLEICMTKTSPSFLQLIAVVTMLIAVVAVVAGFTLLFSGSGVNSGRC